MSLPLCSNHRMVSFWIVVLFSFQPAVRSFTTLPRYYATHHTNRHAEIDSSKETFKEEGERLLAKAKELRSEIDQQEPRRVTTSNEPRSIQQASPWNVADTGSPGVGYRLYIDIGREEGTWMDPRWGASGRRIEFTLDVDFSIDEVANESIKENMIKDNFGGQSSNVKKVTSAPFARLRNGFDRMKSQVGGYRVDVGRNGASTVRFFLSVDGTPEQGSSYGDVSIPKGALYFSLPCFGGGVAQLSTKEGPVTVRQTGWHTGWRREESRIVGNFRAVPIEKAKSRDGF